MSTKMSEWQLTQLFLSDTGVYEVDVHINNSRLRCTCPGYASRTACKHTRYVKARMDMNDGIYPTEVSNKVSKQEALVASKDPKAFRKLLINHGKIEVL